MNKFEYKYHKYKFKYQSLLNQLGGSKNIIYLHGASSSGKTTIGKLLQDKDYALFSIDDYKANYNNQLDIIYELMINEAKKHPKVVFDMGGQGLLEYLDRKNVFVVMIYAPPCDMINNLISRKNEDDLGINGYASISDQVKPTRGDPRGVWAFAK